MMQSFSISQAMLCIGFLRLVDAIEGPHGFLPWYIYAILIGVGTVGCFRLYPPYQRLQ